MRERFESIQYLRGLAALGVVLHHASLPQPWLSRPLIHLQAGGFGVDIFFVISGFIMITAASTARVGKFLQHRFIRVVPLYWLATVLTCALLDHARVLAGDRTLLTHVGQSLLFIPHFSPVAPGRVWPYLVPGWTINIELFFYLVFAVGIGLRRILPVTFIIIGGLALGGVLLDVSGPYWQTWANPVMLEFLAGILIGRHVEALRRPGMAWLLPLGFAAFLASGFIDLPRFIVWGIPAALIVAGTVALERSGKLPRSRWLGALGDASYSLYLFQIIPLRIVARIVARLPLLGLAQPALLFVGGVVAAVIAGFLAHSLLERPLLRAMRRASPPSVAALRR